MWDHRQTTSSATQDLLSLATVSLLFRGGPRIFILGEPRAAPIPVAPGRMWIEAGFAQTSLLLSLISVHSVAGMTMLTGRGWYLKSHPLSHHGTTAATSLCFGKNTRPNLSDDLREPKHVGDACGAIVPVPTHTHRVRLPPRQEGCPSSLPVGSPLPELPVQAHLLREADSGHSRRRSLLPWLPLSA